MRILGFSEKWAKLLEGTFTTFRLERRDTDWQVGEVVQVVYKPRRKGGGEKLGVAKIVDKARRYLEHPLIPRGLFIISRRLRKL